MPRSRRPFALASGLLVVLGSLVGLSAGTAHAVSPNLVVSQVFGGGGNTGAPLTNDFIELYNRSDQAVSLDGLSLQYASATGTGNLGANAGQLTELSGSLEPGEYFLVQQAGGANGSPLPTPDLVDPTPIAMAAGAGKVALVSGVTGLGCNGGSTACSAAQLARIVDLVGYGNANFFEGPAAAPTLSNSTAALRLDDGAQDTDDNGADFEAGAPNPRNTDTEPPPSGCDVPATHQVADVQGSGSATPVAGQTVRVEGVVTGDFQDADQLGGFFLQDDTPDTDPATSEGIFVLSTLPAAVGDRVLASGTATESFGLTQLSSVAAVDVCGTGTVAPATYDLPRPEGVTFEPTEGMLLTFPEALTATEHFQLGRFGEVRVSSDGRLFQPTQLVEPGAPAQAELALAQRRNLLIDDGSNVQNPDTVPFLTPEALRIGDTASGITGVLSFGFSQYRLQPTQPIAFTRTNPRPEAPAPVGGDVQVASFNTLNYFTTLGADNPDARGADTAEEFARQQAKLVAAITELDADVLGLMEIENNGPVAVGNLVDALNAATAPGTYAFVEEPVLNPPNEFGGTFGTDAIKVAIIYRPAEVSPVGAAQSSADPIFDRPPLVQTFAQVVGGEQFTVVVNHFKSKGCDGAVGLDLDQGDGQSCFNARRVAQAQTLASLLDSLDVPGPLLVGDLNSYAEEDPLDVLANAGYASLTEAFVPESERYSFVFDGLSGELDHALAGADLVDNVTGATIWHINADEPLILDYNTEFNPPGLYMPDQFRSSDHDPVLVGLDLNAPPTVDAGGPYSVVEGGTVTLTASASDPDGDPVAVAWDLDGNGTFETTGTSVTFSAAGLEAPETRVVSVRATDPDGLTATDTAEIDVVWDFSGFLPPVQEPPAVNRVRAGGSVPISFSLAGDQGLAVLAPGSPSSSSMTCGGTAPSGETEAIDTPGTSGLAYDPRTDTYTVVWQTDRDWAGTCRQLRVDLADGTSYTALFQFR